MPDIGEAMENLAKSLIENRRTGHTAIVLNGTAILDYDLERAIKWKMRPLNKQMSKRLFGTYGPISTFAAKIDIAYALDIITTELRAELNKFRQMRNAFAHSKLRLNLEEGPGRILFDRLTCPSLESKPFAAAFFDCIIAADEFLEAYLFRMGETEDLAITRKKPPEKEGQDRTGEALDDTMPLLPSNCASYSKE